MKILGIEGMGASELSFELQRGGRFVFYKFCVSALYVTYRRSSDIYFIRPGESTRRRGWRYTLLSLLAGWWGFPWGPIYTIGSIATNLGGGVDVTDQVAASLKGVAYTPDITGPVAQGVRPMWILAALGGIAALVLLGFGSVFWYASRHQHMDVVNGFGVPVAVSVPGVGRIVVPKRDRVRLTLPEGARIVGVRVGKAAAEKVKIDIQSGFWATLKGRDAFVLNPGRGAVLYWETATYSEDPGPGDKGDFRLYSGKPFLTVRNVDYIFESFPKTVEIDENEKAVKTRLDVVRLPPVRLVEAMERLKSPADRILSYAEAHLTFEPPDGSLLKAYLLECVTSHQEKMGVDFLRRGLAARPVRVEWHRAYQDLSRALGRQDEVAAQYDEMLKESPGNSALLYLRGRLCSSNRESVGYFARSIDADPRNPYPWFADAYCYLSEGHLHKALGACRRALALNSSNGDARTMLFKIRFALGDLPALKDEAQSALKRSPGDFEPLDDLLQVCAAQGDKRGARAAVDGFLSHIKGESAARKAEDRAMVRAILAYYEGDAKACLDDLTRAAPSLGAKFQRFQAHLAHLQMTEAELDVQALPGANSAYDHLALAEGWRLAGNGAMARVEMSTTIKKFSASGTRRRTVASLLKGGCPLVLAKVDDLDLEADQKALLCICLAPLYPARRQALLTRARKLDLDLAPPHLLLKTALDRTMKSRGWTN